MKKEKIGMKGESTMVCDGYKALAASIFNLAISDYKKLLKMQKKRKINRRTKGKNSTRN